MKMMKLVTIDVKEVPVQDIRDYLSLETIEHSTRVARSAYCVPDHYVEDLRIPIELWAENGREKLLAIHPDVKFELLSMTATDLHDIATDTIKRKVAQHKFMENSLNTVIDKLEIKVTLATHNTWWTRLKWVFTGVEL